MAYEDDELMELFFGNDASGLEGYTDDVSTPVTTGVPQGFSVPDHYADKEKGIFKSDEQFTNEFNELNKGKMPVMPKTVQARQVPQRSYDDILSAYESPVSDEKQRRLETNRRIIAALGDGISSIANLVGTYNSAPYVAPKATMTETMDARAEKIREEQRKDRQRYAELAYKRARLQGYKDKQQQEANNKAAEQANKANLEKYKADRTSYDKALEAARKGKTNAENLAFKDKALKQNKDLTEKRIKAIKKATGPKTTITTSEMFDDATKERLYEMTTNAKGERVPKLDKQGNPIPLTKKTVAVTR